MATCSFKIKYWDFELEGSKEFQCENKTQTESDKCIFHDEYFLDKEENRKIIVEQFQKKIDEYTSDIKNKPIYFIGYHLFNVNIHGKKFGNSVYFDEASISGSVTIIESTFMSNVSFNNVNFSGRGHVSFSNVTFSGRGDVSFYGAKFLNDGDDYFERTYFSGRGDVSFYGAKFLNKGDVSFIGAKFSKESNMDIVSFIGAKFLNGGGVYFEYSEFSGKGDVQFASTEFSGKGDVSFYRAKFLNDGDVSFRNAKFLNEGRVSFGDVNFPEKCNLDFVFVEFLKHGGVDFTDAQFPKNGGVYFNGSKFSGIASFLCKFYINVFFWSVNFMSPNEVRFDTDDLSQVSFLNTDITRVRFGHNITWGGDGYTIFEEQLLLEELKRHTENELDDNGTENELDDNGTEKGDEDTNLLSLESVLSVYRNLRENYEFRLRYDDAGKFFTKEMELKRKYREVPELSTSKRWKIKLSRKNNTISKGPRGIKENNTLRKHISLTGLYYHFSTYGESILKPVLVGIIILGLSTAFWGMQNNPVGEPSVSFTNSMNTSSNFINFTQISNTTHTLKAFERSLADFLPLLSMPSDTKIGIIDFIVKIVGGGLTFVLLGVALRRKFERKYTK